MYTAKELEAPSELLKDQKNLPALRKAMDPKTLPRKVEELSHSREDVIRLFAAMHPNATMDTLARRHYGMLHREKNEQVLNAVKDSILKKAMRGS